MKLNSLLNTAALLSLVSLVGLQACGTNSNNTVAQNPPPATPTKPASPSATPLPTPAPLDVALSDVQDPAGCLNLEKLYARLKTIPNGANVRQVVTNFSVAPGRGSGGLRPTEKLVQRLSGSSFQTTTTNMESYVGALPKVTQSGCSSVHFDAGDNGNLDQKIVSWANNELTLETENDQYVYQIHDRQLVETHRYSALDFCSESGDRYGVERTSSVRWDEATVLENKPETFNRPYLMRLSESLMTVPDSVRAAAQNNPDILTVEIPAKDVLALSGIDIKPDLKRCHAPQPPPTPTPSPTPVEASGI